jgi:hypothetical protein
MVAGLRSRREERLKQLGMALETLRKQSTNLDGLREKIAASKTTWLVADLTEPPDKRYIATPLLPEFTVLATDGSHIAVDRHRSTRCYLINIGRVMLHYGTQPDAELSSQPYLYCNDEEMVIAPPNGTGRGQLIEGTLLGIKRGVDELAELVPMVRESAPHPTIALLDGSLILWGLEAYPEFVSDILLHGGFLCHLDALRKLGRDRKLAIASYVSFPRSTDVVNVLRLALCPHETVNMDKMCPDCKTRECEAVAQVDDREIFGSLLEPGERSALFINRSKVVREHYGEHQVYFFYVKSDEEIARIEIPKWVADDKDLLDLTHALVLDQCRRGQGYPVALSEAHEQAVVTSADKENFWRLVETSLADERLPGTTSAKSQSKRTRWI